MGQAHSRAFIKVGGQLLPSMPGAKLDMGGVVREPVVGDNRMLGYSEKMKPSSLECELALRQGDSLAFYNNIKDATVTYEADTGQTFVINHAFTSEPVTLSAGDGGKVTLKMSGDPAQEMGV